MSSPAALLPPAVDSVRPLPPKERCAASVAGAGGAGEWESGSSPPISNGEVHLEPGLGDSDGRQLQRQRGHKRRADASRRGRRGEGRAGARGRRVGRGVRRGDEAVDGWGHITRAVLPYDVQLAHERD